MISFFAGGLGGAVSVVINNPIDVIKSCVQSAPSNKPIGSLEAAKHILATKGPKGFLSGLTARVPRLFLSQAIQFMIYDQIMALLRTK